MEILDKLLNYGFLTGSRAFGTAKENSDYDVCYSVDDSPEISEIIDGIEKAPSEYFSGYFITVDGVSINLIPVHPHEYLCWYLATQAMKVTLKTSEIDTPIAKYAVFMGIVSLFKGTVKQRGDLHSYQLIKEKIALLEKDNIVIAEPVNYDLPI